MQAARKAVATFAERLDPAPAPGSLTLAELVRPIDQERWQVRLGGGLREAIREDGVDPALLALCREQSRRVVILAEGEQLMIVGTLQVRRALDIDTQGRVDADVESFKVKAKADVTLQTAAAFIQIKAEQVELFGERVLTRARGVAKTLARMISLN